MPSATAGGFAGLTVQILSREYKVERNTDADHGDGIEQRDNQKHLRPQHRSKLGLPRGTLQKLATEITHSDAYAKSAAGDHYSGRDYVCSGDDFHVLYPLSRAKSEGRSGSIGSLQSRP